jgi:hypothetical protein
MLPLMLLMLLPLLHQKPLFVSASAGAGAVWCSAGAGAGEIAAATATATATAATATATATAAADGYNNNIIDNALIHTIIGLCNGVYDNNNGYNNFDVCNKIRVFYQN